MGTELNIPAHIAIIMDGNGRWAKERGLPRQDGHRAGADSVDAVCRACIEMGVEYLTLYAFSSENWSRPEAEVKALMMLLEQFLKKKSKDLDEQGIRLVAIGQLDRLPARTRKRLEQVVAQTAHHERLTLVLAISYGGREEIVEAAKRLAADVKAGRMEVEAIDGAAFASKLWTNGIPDPDLLIRTSGELRVSNFLLWQISYAEMVIVKKNWPDFRKDDLVGAIGEYSGRHRRFGTV